MPMSFADFESLRFAAEVWKFPPRSNGETEADYRRRWPITATRRISLRPMTNPHQ